MGVAGLQLERGTCADDAHVLLDMRDGASKSEAVEAFKGAHGWDPTAWMIDRKQQDREPNRRRRNLRLPGRGAR